MFYTCLTLVWTTLVDMLCLYDNKAHGAIINTQGWLFYLLYENWDDVETRNGNSFKMSYSTRSIFPFLVRTWLNLPKYKLLCINPISIIVRLVFLFIAIAYATLLLPQKKKSLSEANKRWKNLQTQQTIKLSNYIQLSCQQCDHWKRPVSCSTELVL